MAFIFEIDQELINYSQKVTYCHFVVKECHKRLKFGMVTNLGLENSNMTLVFETDKYLINYAYNLTKSKIY